MNPKIPNNTGISMLRSVMFVTLICCTAAVFATLGDGRGKKTASKKLMNSRPTISSNGFTLKSSYSYRGNQVITESSRKFINLNTVVTIQKGNTTYIVPLKKKVILNNVKIDISNRQLKRN